MHHLGEPLTLTREIAALKIHRADDSAGPLCRIPARCTVRTLGDWQSGMVKIDWQGELYAVFEEDLDVRAVPKDEFRDADQRYA